MNNNIDDASLNSFPENTISSGSQNVSFNGGKIEVHGVANVSVTSNKIPAENMDETLCQMDESYLEPADDNIIAGNGKNGN